MSTKTSIEWTAGDDGTPGMTWNPTTGCDRASAGCDNCYALKMAKRLKGMGAAKYQRDGDPKTSGPGFGVAEHQDTLNDPFGWRKPRRVFVNSMSDLFHDAVSEQFIAQVFAAMAATPQHTYMILTKRHARMRSLLSNLEWRSSVYLRESVIDLAGPAREIPSWPLPNVHVGVSVENQQWADIRIPALLETPAAVRFVSAEPLLGPVDFSKWLRKDECCGCPSAPGERGAPSGRSGRTDDRLGRPDLAGRGETGRPAGRTDTLHPLRTPQGGELGGGLFTGPRHVPGGPSTRHGASTGLAPLPGVDPGRAHGEPQERDEDGQQAGQSGTGYAAGAGASRPECAATGETQPVRPAERDGEADHRTGARDLLPPSGRRVDPCPRCGIRGPGADDLENRERRPQISWLICGGESGPGARPMDVEWVRDLVKQCDGTQTAVFVKQLGAVWASDTFVNGRSVAAQGDRKGGEWDHWPADLRVREFPAVTS